MADAVSAAPSWPSDTAEENALLRALYLAHPDALLLVDTAGLIVKANPAAALLLGYAPDALPGLSVEVLVPHALRARHAEYRQAYGQTPRARPMGTQMELVALRKDGSEVMVEIALSPLLDRGLRYVVAAIRDIGVYPRVQQVVLRARYSDHLAMLGRLAVDARDPQRVVDQAPAIAADALRADAAMVYLLQGNWVDLRLAAGVGLAPGESVGTRLPQGADTLPGRVLQQGQPIRADARQPETRQLISAAHRTAGLDAALAVPLSDRGRTIGALVVHARTAQHLGDDALRFLESVCNLLATCLQRAQSENALEHAQRLESVGQLTGGIAHDFNNLLTVIQGSLQVLEELPTVTEDAQGRQLVAAAARASRRGAELTGKLLAFSRRQVLQPSAVDVGQLVHSVAGMLRRTMDQRIRIEVDASATCPPVLADPGQLESALLNIAINARDAMLDGGRLHFRADACSALPAEVRNHLDDPSAPQDGFVAIAISDTGCGMPDEVKLRAFEPFFTTKEAGRGTGLGLSTVYGFVKQSKGALALESAPDAGTTLTLYLPRPWHTEPPAPVDAPTQQTVPQGLRVLLVEDDADVRDVVRAFLDSLQCRVTQASSGEQALLALGPDSDFDLLLSDIALGAGMRGTRLAELAQQRLPKLCVLLMSGYSSELLLADRESPLSWELLRKPYTRADLAAAIAKLLAARDDAG